MEHIDRDEIDPTSDDGLELYAQESASRPPAHLAVENRLKSISRTHREQGRQQKTLANLRHMARRLCREAGINVSMAQLEVKTRPELVHLVQVVTTLLDARRLSEWSALTPDEQADEVARLRNKRIRNS